MFALATLGLVAAASLAVVHDPHGCPEAPHDVRAFCNCVDNGQAGAARSYYQPRVSTYRRPGYHPRPYPVPPTYEPPAYYPPPREPMPPAYYGGVPDYYVRGRPVQVAGGQGYVQGPRVYVDAPPVYVEPAQIYIERPEVIVRPSEVIVAPPEVHFGPCPEGVECYQDPSVAAQPQQATGG